MEHEADRETGGSGVTLEGLTWNEQAGVWEGSGPLETIERALIVVAHPDDVVRFVQVRTCVDVVKNERPVLAAR